MKHYILESLKEIETVSNDILMASCIGEPSKSNLLKYLEGRKNALEDVLEILESGSYKGPDDLHEETNNFIKVLTKYNESQVRDSEVSELITDWITANNEFLKDLNEIEKED